MRSHWLETGTGTALLREESRQVAGAFENIELTARSEQVVEFKCPNTSSGAYSAAEDCPKQP